jgi:hypothetical protein
VIGLVALIVHVLPSPTPGFLLAGAVAAGGYALAISLVDAYGQR